MLLSDNVNARQAKAVGWKAEKMTQVVVRHMMGKAQLWLVCQTGSQAVNSAVSPGGGSDCTRLTEEAPHGGPQTQLLRTLETLANICPLMQKDNLKKWTRKQYIFYFSWLLTKHHLTWVEGKKESIGSTFQFLKSEWKPKMLPATPK